MEVYFNEEAAWEPGDGYTRGIPSEYEELFESVERREPVFVDGGEEGLIQNIRDGDVYGIFEKQEDPFTDYILEIGRYDEEASLIEDVTVLEQQHVGNNARVVKKGSKHFTRLVEIRTRLMEDRWDSKLVDLTEEELECLAPIH